MLNKLFSNHKKQKGFTLVELLVALAITAVIGSTISMTISQLFSVSIGDKNRMEAVKQVENALHYINRDAQSASASQVPNGPNFPLELKWTNYVDGFNYDVLYSLNGNNLVRTQTTNAPSSEVMTVASNINTSSTLTNYSFDGDTLTINLTSTVNGYRSATESRTLQVKPRVN